MRVRPSFTFSISVCVCVRACVRVCMRACSFQLFFYCAFSSGYIFYIIIYQISDTINFTCPLSRWQYQYQNCSRSPTQDQSSLAHDFPLPRSPLTSMYTRSTDKTCSTHFAQSPVDWPQSLMPFVLVKLIFSETDSNFKLYLWSSSRLDIGLDYQRISF